MISRYSLSCMRSQDHVSEETDFPHVLYLSILLMCLLVPLGLKLVPDRWALKKLTALHLITYYKLCPHYGSKWPYHVHCNLSHLKIRELHFVPFALNNPTKLSSPFSHLYIFPHIPSFCLIRIHPASILYAFKAGYPEFFQDGNRCRNLSGGSASFCL